MTLRNNKILTFLLAALLGTAAQAADLPIVAVAQFESTVDNEVIFEQSPIPTTTRRCLKLIDS